MKEQKEYLLNLLTLLQDYIDDTGSEILPEGRFLDWPTKDDNEVVHAGLQALLILSFDAGAFLCDVIEEKSIAEKCREIIVKLKKHNPDAGNNKQANALKCLAGLDAPEKINDETLAVNPYDEVSTFYGYYVLEARAKAEDYQGALDLIRKYWGQGIASEAAFELLKFGFGEKNLDKICAEAHINNASSNRVLQKSGLKFIETFNYAGEMFNWYEIKKNDWIELQKITNET